MAYLQRLGFFLARLRGAAGLTQYELGRGTHISRQQVARIEAGTRRTRASTLRAMAEVLAATPWANLGDPEELTEQLVDLAGPALAPESDYAEKIAAGRLRRVARWDLQKRLQALVGEFDAQQRASRRELRDGERQDRWINNLLGG